MVKIKKNYGNGHTNHIRASVDLEKIINYIKARALLEGKKMPTTNKITEKIAEKINREELWNEFI